MLYPSKLSSLATLRPLIIWPEIKNPPTTLNDSYPPRMVHHPPLLEPVPSVLRTPLQYVTLPHLGMYMQWLASAPVA